MVSIKREELRRRFPFLAEELDRNKMRLQIDSVRSVSEEADKAVSNFGGYVPTAIDYLRRCDIEEEALGKSATWNLKEKSQPNTPLS